MIDRFLEVLDVFRTSGGPLTASQIARRTSIPMASAHRIIGDMVRVGVLVKDENRRLSIGMRLWEIGARSSTARTLRESALPHMETLMVRFQAPVLLCVLDRNDVVNVETLTPRGPVATNVTRPGVRLPAIASSPGIVLLAHSAPEVREQVLARAKPTRFTAHTPMRRSEISRLIDEAAELGYSVASHWMWLGSTGIAVPILGPDRLAVASLSVTVPVGSTDVAAVARTLKDSARSIARFPQPEGSSGNPDIAMLMHQLRRATEGPESRST